MLSFLTRKKPILPAVPEGMRIYAIGDIHGRLDLFEDILEQIREDVAGCSDKTVRIILLGDMIDRGPDSAGVVARAMAPLDFAALVALRGNHESAMLDALDGKTDSLWLWMKNGGDVALASWGVSEDDIRNADAQTLIAAADACIPKDQRAWIGRCQFHFTLGDYYFVHAGVRPGVPLDRQTMADKLWIRDEFLNSGRMHGAMIVHGHSVSRTVEELPNRIGIDTGAYRTGRLTALALEGTDRWYLNSEIAGIRKAG